jgi:hypothetical protein
VTSRAGAGGVQSEENPVTSRALAQAVTRNQNEGENGERERSRRRKTVPPEQEVERVKAKTPMAKGSKLIEVVDNKRYRKEDKLLLKKEITAPANPCPKDEARTT